MCFHVRHKQQKKTARRIESTTRMRFRAAGLSKVQLRLPSLESHSISTFFVVCHSGNQNSLSFFFSCRVSNACTRASSRSSSTRPRGGRLLLHSHSFFFIILSGCLCRSFAASFSSFMTTALFYNYQNLSRRLLLLNSGQCTRPLWCDSRNKSSMVRSRQRTKNTTAPISMLASFTPRCAHDSPAGKFLGRIQNSPRSRHRKNRKKKGRKKNVPNFFLCDSEK